MKIIFRLSILPLHSDIAVAQQMEVFKRADLYHRKIIVSTSIAESSITVPDIKYGKFMSNRESVKLKKEE